MLLFSLFILQPSLLFKMLFAFTYAKLNVIEKVIICKLQNIWLLNVCFEKGKNVKC